MLLKTVHKKLFWKNKNQNKNFETETIMVTYEHLIQERKKAYIDI